MKIRWFVVILVVLSLYSVAQDRNIKVVETVTVDGKVYLLHKVEQGETLFSICKKYNIEQKELVGANPQLIFGLKQGDDLKIPYTGTPKITAEKPTAENIQDQNFKEAQQSVNGNNAGEYFYHTIETGDTFYSYQRRFGVTRKMLVDLNPELNDGLQVGLRIKIPSAKIPKVEVVPLQPDKFIGHIVKQGETLYGISKQYNVKVLDIKKLNPELKTRGLIAGETIYISKDELNLNDENKAEEEAAGQIQPQQVKAESALPEVMFKYEEEKQPECNVKYPAAKRDTFRIAMFLPLYFDKNDTFNLDRISGRDSQVLDSLKAIDPVVLKKYFKIVFDSISMNSDTILIDSLKVKQVRSLCNRPSRMAVSFYQGVLIALDSMQRAGSNVRLDLYDTERGLKKINRVLSDPDFINTDMIVGPIDTVLQKRVSDYSAKNHIPMVSPFTTCQTILNNNPFYFQSSPSIKYMLRKTADYIADEYYDKNFMIITMNNNTKPGEFEMVKMVREKFFSRKVLNSENNIMFTQVDFSGADGYWQVKKTLRKDVENVIFIPTTDNRYEREALLSRAINSLNVLAEEYSITLIGVIDYPTFNSIKTEYFHKLKLHFLTPNYIDYSRPDVNSFIRKFRKNFDAEPDIYSYRGNDIITYFVGAYQAYGKNFKECIRNYESCSLQCDFNFQKVQQLGGYMNHTLYIMNYAPDYKVKVVSEITEGRILKK